MTLINASIDNLIGVLGKTLLQEKNQGTNSAIQRHVEGIVIKVNKIERQILVMFL